MAIYYPITLQMRYDFILGFWHRCFRSDSPL